MTDPAGPADAVQPEHTTTTGKQTSAGRDRAADPLRTSPTSQVWLALAALAVVLVLLVVFIAQNTTQVPLAFLGWDWHPPLAVALLAAAAAGLLLAVIAGSLRILQLRRRVHRDVKRTRS